VDPGDICPPQKQPSSAQPGRAPAPPNRRTPPVSNNSPSCVPSLSRSLPMGLTCRCQFPSPARSLSLCLAGPVRQLSSHCPARPLFSLCAVELPCQFCLPHARHGPACAHSRTSPGFSARMPTDAPSSLLRAPPLPRTRPSPHFTHPRSFSRSALAARRRRRPASVFPTIQLTGDRAKPP
jgi:hypothetical protein